MNREIKFRAKLDFDVDSWTYGLPFIHPDYNQTAVMVKMEYSEPTDKLAVVCCTTGITQINPSTICEFTGILDADGKEIYEGDIVDFWDRGQHTIAEVKRRETGAFFFLNMKIAPHIWNIMPRRGRETVKVIGNIFDNPELLKKQL